MAEIWLVVFLGYKFLSLFDVKVVYQWIVVIPADQLGLNYFKNIGQAFLI